MGLGRLSPVMNECSLEEGKERRGQSRLRGRKNLLGNSLKQDVGSNLVTSREEGARVESKLIFLSVGAPRREPAPPEYRPLFTRNDKRIAPTSPKEPRPPDVRAQ